MPPSLSAQKGDVVELGALLISMLSLVAGAALPIGKLLGVVSESSALVFWRTRALLDCGVHDQEGNSGGDRGTQQGARVSGRA